MKRSNMSKLILSEADWLDEAAKNAEALGQNSAQFMAGFRTAANWVRFHGNHPHLLEGRVSGKEE